VSVIKNRINICFRLGSFLVEYLICVWQNKTTLDGIGIWSYKGQD